MEGLFDLTGIKVQIDNSLAAFNDWFSNVGSSNFANNWTLNGPLVEFARTVAAAKGWN